MPKCGRVRRKNLIDPVLEMNNSNNPAGGRMTTVIGGNVYCGNKILEFRGKYLFGSFSQPGNVPNGELFISSPRAAGTGYGLTPK